MGGKVVVVGGQVGARKVESVRFEALVRQRPD